MRVPVAVRPARYTRAPSQMSPAAKATVRTTATATSTGVTVAVTSRVGMSIGESKGTNDRTRNQRASTSLMPKITTK